MKTISAILFCFIALQSMAQTTVAHKPSFEYTDTVFYEGQVMVRRNITFWDGPRIENSTSYAALDSLGSFLINHPNLYIEISTYRDSRAGSAYNLEWTEKCALRVLDYLVEKGINKSRIAIKGYGETMLLNKCKDGIKCTQEEHSVNRRVEFKILSLNKPTFDYTDTAFYVGQIMTSRNISIAISGGFRLSENSISTLDSIYNFMAMHPGIILEIGCHTSCRSGSEYNLDFSDKISVGVQDYLISKGIAIERLVAKGYGESQPLNKCVDGVKCTEEEHQQNRRTEFKIINTGQ